GSSTGRLGALLMLSTAVLWSAGAAFDKAALKHASPLTHLALLLGSSVLILHLVRTLFIREPKASFTVSWKPLFLVCATMLISIALQLAAYSHWEVAYIETIKRAIGLVGSVTLGALIFKERGFRRRLFSVCVMAIGTTILILGQ
ncbi:MAG: EamA family transporter, partial [Bradymonadia bacterium]